MIDLTPPAEWLEGQLLELTTKIIVPALPEECADPTTAITDAHLIHGTFSAHASDRLRLVRMMSMARHAICKHASGALVMVSSKYLMPAHDL